MADIVFVTIVVAFFAAAGGFVLLCDRIIGSVEDATMSTSAPLLPVEPPAAKAA